jgi:hypothetical protein
MANARRRWTDPPDVAVSKLGPPVRFALMAESTYLAVWGRDPTGRWWALIAWAGYLRYDFRQYVALCSGWVLAADVFRLDGVDYSGVARLRLGPDPSAWPRPGLATDLHYAPLTRATPAKPPDGASWDRTLASRRKKARFEQWAPERRWPPGRRE